MSEALKIRLAARCEAAGRSENEDNYQVAENLSENNFGFVKDKIFSLGDKGTLLLVCDGMGGMNAGEVASKIGVDTIKSMFVSQLLTDDVFANDESICTYMRRAIIKADSRIKEEAAKDEAKHGMGSTAVMAWLLGSKVYVAWCGDSRCYRFNPVTGLEQLSHDHSYVQDLVDTGQLSADLAFDHPNKNIITRSLGDPRGAARPDAKVYDLHLGDVILLCSDGLSDSLRDSEIENSMRNSLTSMVTCIDTLWNNSQQAGWHDNVTIILAQVVDGNIAKPQPQPQPQLQMQSARPVEHTSQRPQQSSNNIVTKLKLNWKIIVSIVATILVVVALIFALPILIEKLKNWNSNDVENNKQETEMVKNDGEIRQEIRNIIDPQKTDTINKEGEDRLLNIAENNPSLRTFIVETLDTKKNAINKTELVENPEKQQRCDKIDNIISKINKLQ